MASKGYPGSYEKNTPITALPQTVDGEKVFHAGTALKDGELVATGGRVLNVIGQGATLEEARNKAYRVLDQIDLPGGHYRTDIALPAVEGRISI